MCITNVTDSSFNFKRGSKIKSSEDAFLCTQLSIDSGSLLWQLRHSQPGAT